MHDLTKIVRKHGQFANLRIFGVVRYKISDTHMGTSATIPLRIVSGCFSADLWNGANTSRRQKRFPEQYVSMYELTHPAALQLPVGPSKQVSIGIETSNPITVGELHSQLELVLGSMILRSCRQLLAQAGGSSLMNSCTKLCHVDGERCGSVTHGGFSSGFCFPWLVYWSWLVDVDSD